jgi:hypothetical protein
MMINATTYNDLSIREASINDIICFKDNTKFIVVEHFADNVGNYSLIQVKLQRILKNGSLGKQSVWIKFRKY